MSRERTPRDAEDRRSRRRSRRQAEAEPEEAVAEAEPAAPEEPPVKYERGKEFYLRGKSGAWNFTRGPALIYRGPKSIDVIYKLGEPVVLVADMIPMNELRKIDLTRIRGFVFELGKATDEEFYNFLQNEKRAAVIACKGALYVARGGPEVIVDGCSGVVCFNPEPKTVEAFEKVRAKGPPKRERMEQVAEAFNAMLEDAIENRKEQEAAGKHVGHEEHTKSEVLQMHKEAPGLVLQLLSGLPIKGAPGAEEAGYIPGPEQELQIEAKPVKSTAAERRAKRESARQQQREVPEGEAEAAAAKPAEAKAV